MAQSPAGKLIKATTDVLFSPFKLVASFLGGGSDEVRPAAAAPVSAAPATPKATATKEPRPRMAMGEGDGDSNGKKQSPPKKKALPKRSPKKVIVKAEALRVQPRRQIRRKSAGGGFYTEANQQQLGCAPPMIAAFERTADLVSSRAGGTAPAALATRSASRELCRWAA